jgi:ribonuclease D
MNYKVQFLERQHEFDQVMLALDGQPWIGFDTEFVGEKTYVPVLCLIQIVSEQNIYLVDTLRINDLSRFLRILSDPETLKITHAGDNDYRLLNILYGVTPQNTFDTQIAAGFVGYNYPAGFGKIVERELSVTLAKSHTVANWEARPLDPKAIDYAVEDVKYLPALHQKLTNKLRRKNREAWTREENRKWETPDFYYVDPYKEVLANDHIYSLDFKEKIFLVRLYNWRREKAAHLNVPKETVLQSRHISTVLRATKGGPNAFKANRTLQENVWKRNIDEWQVLWQNKPTDEERAFLEALPQAPPDDPDHEWTMELLYHLVRKQCIEHEISAALLLPKGDFNRLKAGNDTFDHGLLSGWRAELLGPKLVDWLQRGEHLNMDWDEHGCRLSMKKEN